MQKNSRLSLTIEIFKKITLFVFSLFLFSCTSPEKRVKKIISRLNEGEIALASKYIHPDDYSKLYIFNKRFIENDNTFYIELLSTTPLSPDNEENLIVKYKITSRSEYLNQYFKSLNKFNDGVVTDTVYERSFKGEQVSSFNFGFEDSILYKTNFKLASINTSKINLRERASLNSAVLHQLNQGDEIVIDATFEKNNFRKGVYFKNNGDFSITYFSSKLSSADEINFFNLGWVDSLGILFLFLLAIAVAIIIYPLLLVSLLRTGAEGAGYFAIIILIIFAITVFSTYQIIEKAIFEIFLINLPY